MIYFNSKYLSDNLGINNAKWKRWSREFLQPDPLGGYQSGYARQFSYKDAFQVFFAGYMVSELKFSVSETRQMLKVINPWLRKQGFFGLPTQKSRAIQQNNHIYIAKLPSGKFAYAVRAVDENQVDEKMASGEQRYSLIAIDGQGDFLQQDVILHARVIMINSLYRYFIGKLQ